MEQARRAREKAKKDFKSRPPIIDFALQFLRCGTWTAIPTDKDGGYAVVPRGWLEEAKGECVDDGHYIETTIFSDTAEELLGEFSGVCREVACEDHKLFRALLSDAQLPNKIYQRLQVTCKTHKAKGNVTLRAIHSSVGSPFKPAMRLASLWLAPALARLDHLLQDSFALTDILRRRTWPPNLVFIQFDIKDFFMSGGHTDIVDRCSGYVEPSVETKFRKLVMFILQTQFVTVDGRPGRAYRVDRGTGMGLSFSGDLSNLTFHDLVEKWATSAQVRADHRIWYYGRYMDDGLIIADADPARYGPFLDGIRSRASSCFEVVFETPTSKPIMFLDLELSLGDRYRSQRRIDFKMVSKATSIARPLAPSSMHPRGVHNAWPSALLHRAWRLTSGKVDYDAEKSRRENLWRSNNIFPRASSEKPSNPLQGPSANNQIVRIVLPFAPVWGSAGLGRSIASVQALWRQTFEGTAVPLRVGIAWSLGGTHLVHTLGSSRQEGTKLWSMWRRKAP